jgi:hypothetical protein
MILGTAQVNAAGGTGSNANGGGAGIGSGGYSSYESNVNPGAGSLVLTSTAAVTATGGAAASGLGGGAGAGIGLGGYLDLNSLQPVDGTPLTLYTVAGAASPNAGGRFDPPAYQASAGTRVTFSIIANPGYAVSSVANGAAALTDNGDGTYTLANVTGDIAVTATFNPIIPDAPTGVSAVAGNASALVYFTTPDNAETAIVTGYTVTATPVFGGAQVFASGTGSPIMVTGLTNGQTYAFTVHANNFAGSGPESAMSNMVIPQAAPPTVTGISPPSGPTAGGTNVTITGTNFTGTTGVTFGGLAAFFIIVNSDTSITAITPARSAGPANVQVTTAIGASALVAAAVFTYADDTDTIFRDGFDG